MAELGEWVRALPFEWRPGDSGFESRCGNFYLCVIYRAVRPSFRLSDGHEGQEFVSNF